MLADLTAVDYLTHPGRTLPDGVAPERFELVASLLSLSAARRVRIRVQVPEADAVVDSVWDLYPGAEAMEREVFDMFGICFTGHPDDPDPHARGLGGLPPAQGLRRRPGPRAVQRIARAPMTAPTHTRRRRRGGRGGRPVPAPWT